ncbi:MAG: hypothetical protein HC892_08160 [Saprospiraceae bacterium]|nr:hypothetical protein [Saprospiraceae bacterium]
MSVFVGWIAVGCEREALISNVVFVDPNLQTYFDSFELAAKTRGIEVDLSSEGIAAFLLPINEGSVIGKCSSNTDNKKITIDSDFWRSASRFERELVVFHELGHCYLQRNHLDTANGDGTCTSLMHSGLTNCRSNYNSVTRARYLDELFK